MPSRSVWICLIFAIHFITEWKMCINLTSNPSWFSACCFCCFHCSPSRPPPCCWGEWSRRATHTDTHHIPPTTGAGAQTKVTASLYGSSTSTLRTATSVRTMLWRSVASRWQRLGINTFPVICNSVALLSAGFFQQETYICPLWEKGLEGASVQCESLARLPPWWLPLTLLLLGLLQQQEAHWL